MGGLVTRMVSNGQQAQMLVVLLISPGYTILSAGPKCVFSVPPLK